MNLLYCVIVHLNELDFRCGITEKVLKLTQKVENGEKIVSTSFQVRAAPEKRSNTQQTKVKVKVDLALVS